MCILCSRVVRGLGRSLNAPYEACVKKSWKMATAEPVSRCITLRRIVFLFFSEFRSAFVRQSVTMNVCVDALVENYLGM